ncbi:MAG: hypothetical protein QG645_259 [Patescibacteria group bacterium]|nr:hypothetical protein [Patescibacteria group bacterium]
MDDIRPPQKITPNREDSSAEKEPFSLDSNSSDNESTNIKQEDYNLKGSSLPVSSSKKKRSKKTTITILLLIILLLISVGVSGYLYYKQQDMQKQIDTLTAENIKLKEQVYTLKYDNKDSDNKQKLLIEQNELYLEKMNMLKTNCGSNCKDITLPQ